MKELRLTSLIVGLIVGFVVAQLTVPAVGQLLVVWSKGEVLPVVLVKPGLGGFEPVVGSALGNRWTKEEVLPMCGVRPGIGGFEPAVGSSIGNVWSKDQVPAVVFVQPTPLGFVPIQQPDLLSSAATPVGVVRLVGVCIPWRDAHVSTGRKDRKPWEDHRACLEGFGEILCGYDSSVPLIVLGEWNQRIPRYREPVAVANLFQSATQRLRIATAGKLSLERESVIDHLAHCSSLSAANQGVWNRTTTEGLRLSDHRGLAIELSSRLGPAAPAVHVVERMGKG